MLFFRIFLFAIIFVVGAYTFPVVMDYGLLSLFPNFFGEIRQLSWQGQFNLDFFTFLLLSGFWLVWRNQFSPLGFALGLGGVLLGAPYLALYLLYLSYLTNGDVPKMLLGARVNKWRISFGSPIRIAYFVDLKALWERNPQVVEKPSLNAVQSYNVFSYWFTTSLILSGDVNWVGHSCLRN